MHMGAALFHQQLPLWMNTASSVKFTSEYCPTRRMPLHASTGSQEEFHPSLVVPHACFFYFFTAFWHACRRICAVLYAHVAHFNRQHCKSFYDGNSCVLQPGDLNNLWKETTYTNLHQHGIWAYQ